MAVIKFNRIKKDETTEPMDKGAENIEKSPLETSPPLPTVDSVPQNEPKIETPKRRGRPPGRKNNPVIPLDIAPPLDGLEVEPEAKAKRGRKKKGLEWDAAKLAEQIEGWHAMLDVFIPGTAISNTKAKMLADSMVNVAEAYDIHISAKVTSLIGLATAVAIVEVPVALKVRYTLLQRSAKQKAKEIAKQEHAATDAMTNSVMGGENIGQAS